MAKTEKVKKTKTETPSKGFNLKLGGTWFVHFGIEGVVEGSRIMTLKGKFDGETFLADMADAIEESLSEEVKKVIKESGYKRLVIRNMVKLA